MLLRTARYTGRPLPAHLAIPDLSEAHFRRWLALFTKTVEDICSAELAALFMDRALWIAHSFQLAIRLRSKAGHIGVKPVENDGL